MNESAFVFAANAVAAGKLARSPYSLCYASQRCALKKSSTSALRLSSFRPFAVHFRPSKGSSGSRFFFCAPKTRYAVSIRSEVAPAKHDVAENFDEPSNNAFANSNNDDGGRPVYLFFSITGMMCEGCVKDIEQSLKSVPGVVSASVILETSSAAVSFHPTQTDSDDLVSAIKEAGGGGKFSATPYFTHKWDWKGHKITYAVAGGGRPILFIHGFGASIGHWRKNIPFLASNGFKVYAIDLLGFGNSDKAIVPYSIELWRDLVLDFIRDFVQEPIVVGGNSIGGLVAASVAYAGGRDLIRGAVLFNCSGGMNSKGLFESGWQLLLAAPLLAFLDLALNTPFVRNYLFDKFRSRENIKQVLQTVYSDTSRVDDELVEMIYRPSCDAGAPEVFANVITGPPGVPPQAFAKDIQSPILLLWGTKDPWTPDSGPVARFFKDLAAERDDVTWVSLPETGHCPHDDRPALVHDALLPWLKRLWSSSS